MRIIVLALLAAVSLNAQEPVTIDSMGHPGLLLKTNVPGVFVEAPTVSTDIAIQVRGVVARGVVRQTFENRTDHCVEAVYVFPLADNATVDAMRMKIGVRTIEGEIKERAEAAQVYEQARSAGQSASLLEQHRPNLFTVSVASLPSGETAQIEIEYQQIVTYDDGRFSLRVPLAIGPRYTPANSTATATVPQTRYEHGRKPVTLSIDLDSGIELDAVTSATHAIETTTMSATRVVAKPRAIFADRDFELAWTPRLGTAVHSAEFTETIGGDRYSLVMMFPPDVSRNPSVVIPREAIYIIDTSGSMGGPSIEQAKKALASALARLRTSDRFNVIEFNSTARAIFTTSRTATRDAVDEAIQWVSALEANNGTEMLSALQLALDDHPIVHGEVRQVVFITDGQVGNESEVFEYIRAHLGGARLFTIGIGSAPNTFFMRSAARIGRGTFTQIGDVGEVDERMTSMFRKLESPVITNVAMTFTGGEAWPRDVPDLYAGEPLVVTVKNPKARIRGDEVVSIEGTGIAKLWARQKIDALRDSVFTGAKADEVKKEIVATALAHHLVTEETSLVAVDTTPNGVDAKSCTPELVPVSLPAGWGGVEGSLPQTGTNALLWILIGLALVVIGKVMR